MGRLGRVLDAPRWVIWGTRVLARGGYDLVTLFRGGQIADAIEPWKRVDDVADLPFDEMAATGARAVLFDLENTIIPPGGPFDDFGLGVIERARAAGLQVGVVSNASAGWVKPELERVGVFGIAPAGKPAPTAFLDACRHLGVEPQDAVYVGDQVITDVLGSQRAGMRAILVKPKYAEEFRSAKFQRLVARIVIALTSRREPKV